MIDAQLVLKNNLKLVVALEDNLNLLDKVLGILINQSKGRYCGNPDCEFAMCVEDAIGVIKDAYDETAKILEEANE